MPKLETISALGLEHLDQGVEQQQRDGQGWRCAPAEIGTALGLVLVELAQLRPELARPRRAPSR